MQVGSLTEWLSNPATQLLLVYLHRRKAAVLQTFLQGQPVDQVAQGRAVAFHELETLLALPVDGLKQILEHAVKEQKI